ncbi:MAG: sensor histidine kinase [Candidatus Sericytochromatia bacterium]|nr:sensor histidine kinase [Candidatus Sericytochromatia bacterium]
MVPSENKWGCMPLILSAPSDTVQSLAIGYKRRSHQVPRGELHAPHHLMRHAGQVISQERLLAHIKNLRRKVDADHDTKLIRTVRRLKTLIDDLLALARLDAAPWSGKRRYCTVQLVRIFDRFFQVDDVTEGRPGSGLGLAIAQVIAQSHDGRLTVISEPGIGSTFTLQLPLHAGHV